MAQFNDMLAQIGAMLSKKENKLFSYEELASMLKTSPDALKTFEDVYKTQVLESGTLSDNLLQWDTATVKECSIRACLLRKSWTISLTKSLPS